MNKILELKAERADERRIRRRINNLSELGAVSLAVVKNILQMSNNADGVGGGRRSSLMSEEMAAVKIQRVFRYAWGLSMPSTHSVDNGAGRRLLERVDGGRGRGRQTVDTEESSRIVVRPPGPKMSLKEALEEKVDGKRKVEGKHKLALGVRKKITGMLTDNGAVLNTSKRDLLIKNSKPRVRSPGPRKRRQTALLRASIGTERTPSFNKDGASHRNAYTSEVNKKSMLGRSTLRVTGNKVGLGMILTFILMVVFTYFEFDASSAQTMITLHNIERESSGFTTKNLTHVNRAVKVILANTPGLYHYQFTDKSNYRNHSIQFRDSDLRARERSQITICTGNNATNATSCTCSIGKFDIRPRTRRAAWASLLLTLFMIIFWWMAVMMYTVPVSGLLVIPIQRMVAFLGMLVKDPLGYQQTPEYHQFVSDEERILIRTGWSKEVMDGMETSFLMSTLTRISSLMKVGFGSAGVDIIRSNLRGEKDVHFQNLVGTTVSCIFVFGDIRSFTDVSECLQEEIFVFTNRIASVVHSYCNSYGGAVNKILGMRF